MDVDVLVVGGGPSGLTVGAEIARTGASVLVLERRAVAPIPRAGTVIPRPLELFDARGIADRFVKRTCEVNPHPYLTWHIWAGMGPVDWSKRDSRFGFTLMLAQHESEIILRDWAIEAGADIRFEHEVVELVDRGDDVRALVRRPGQDDLEVIAGYVVGADGGRGPTRDFAGIGVSGREDTFTGVIATANMAFPWPGGTRVQSNERGWLAAYPFGVGLTRFTMVHVERRAAARNEPVTVEEMNECVSEIFEEPIEIPSLAGGTRYGDAMWIADQFRKGRVFLLGEAARIHYPASGVGMNFCIQDAFNLGWKLGAVVGGHAGDALLDTYEAERRPVSVDLFDSVDAQVAVQFDFSRRGRALVEHFATHLIRTGDVTEQLWDELNGLRRQYPQPDDRPAPVGYPAPDFEMFLPDGSTTRLHELLRNSPFVVLDFSGERALQGLDLADHRATVVQAHPIRRPAAYEGLTAAIVRPDAYVAWATTVAPNADDVRGELQRVLCR